MTSAIIITLIFLLLLSYVFDISSAKTRIPPVILLLMLGLGVRQVSLFLKIPIPELSSVLPLLGTIGLILIVLEGSLELEVNKSKLPLIGKTTIISIIQLLFISLVLAYFFQYFGHTSYKIALANAIPFAIISSAIAIPSARNLCKSKSEFITYDSSLSDIFGVIFFNFIALNKYLGSQSVWDFILQLLVMIVISFIVTIALAIFLSKIKHHIKFTPIILVILLIYNVSKIYHLPALIFILFFGLFIVNVDKIKNIKFNARFNPLNFRREVMKFKVLTSEITFLVRSLFFLLFGYLIEIKEITNIDTIFWALFITTGIFLFRALILLIFRYPLMPLVFIAPRGLITILLFLSIPVNQIMELPNRSLVIQVIILTSFIMMFGLIIHKKNLETNSDLSESDLLE